MKRQLQVSTRCAHNENSFGSNLSIHKNTLAHFTFGSKRQVCKYMWMRNKKRYARCPVHQVLRTYSRIKTRFQFEFAIFPYDDDADVDADADGDDDDDRCSWHLCLLLSSHTFCVPFYCNNIENLSTTVHTHAFTHSPIFIYLQFGCAERHSQFLSLSPSLFSFDIQLLFYFVSSARHFFMRTAHTVSFTYYIAARVCVYTLS